MLDPYSQRVAMGTQEVGSSLVAVIRGQFGWTLGGRPKATSDVKPAYWKMHGWLTRIRAVHGKANEPSIYWF